MSAQRSLFSTAPKLCPVLLPGDVRCVLDPGHDGVHYDGRWHHTEGGEWSRRRDAERAEFDAKAKRRGKR